MGINEDMKYKENSDEDTVTHYAERVKPVVGTSTIAISGDSRDIAKMLRAYALEG